MCSITHWIAILIYTVWISPALSAPKNNQTHLRYTETDEIEAGHTIGYVAQDANLAEKYRDQGDVLVDFQFRVFRGEYKDKFDIQTYQGELKTTERIDRDVLCPQEVQCDIELDVAIIQPQAYFQIIKVTITLEDSNDNAPTFLQPRTTIRISENAAPGVSFVLPSAEDPDSPENGISRYDILDPTNTFALAVTENTENLMDVRLELLKHLNREATEKYSLPIMARDGGTPRQTGTIMVDVVVVDANDNSPVFDQPLYNTSVSEDTNPSMVIITVHATDPDHGPNGEVRYSFSQQTQTMYGDIFHINSQSGAISLKQRLDYETETSYTLVVNAVDLGPDSVPANAKVVIEVLDVNDYMPRMAVTSWTPSGQIEVLENTEPGVFVAHVSVEDLDHGPSGKVTCRVTDSEAFGLEQIGVNAYKLVTSVMFDRETQATYDLEIECEDKGEPPLKQNKDLMVHILDENDHPPAFRQNLYEVTVVETVAIATPILVVNATDMDIDQNADISYYLHSSEDLVKIDAKSGVITTNARLDYESMASFDFYVVAADQGTPSLSATATVIITITDANDEPPKFLQSSYNFGTFENQHRGSEVGTLSASDRDAPPYDEFVFSLVDPENAFMINNKSGIITTRKILDREHQSAYYLVAKVTNVNEPYLSSSASVTIYVVDKNDNAPKIIYPVGDNTTIEISGYMPKGSSVIKFKAEDSDHGNNARLMYTIAKGNKENMFSIDPVTGDLKVRGELMEGLYEDYVLLVQVRDQGEELEKSAVTELRIHVNRTLAFYKTLDFSNLEGKNTNIGVADFFTYHHKILIILGAATLVLVIILITAIFCIKKRQGCRQRDSYKYMCRVDLPNHIASMAPDAGMTELMDTSGESTSKAVSDQKKSVSFDLRDSGLMGSNFSGSMSDISTGSQVIRQVSAIQIQIYFVPICSVTVYLYINF